MSLVWLESSDFRPASKDLPEFLTPRRSEKLSRTDNKIPVTADIGIGLQRGARELVLLAIAAVALFYLISLLTFNIEDAGWTHTGYGLSISNGAGSIGAWLSDFSFSMIGVVAYTVPLLFASYGYALYKGEFFKTINPFYTVIKFFGLVVFVIAGTGLADLKLTSLALDLPQTSAGGILGEEITTRMFETFGGQGTLVVLVFGALAGLSLMTGISWLAFLDGVGKCCLYILNGFMAVFVPAPSSPSMQEEQLAVAEPVEVPPISVAQPLVQAYEAPVVQSEPAEVSEQQSSQPIQIFEATPPEADEVWDEPETTEALVILEKSADAQKIGIKVQAPEPPTVIPSPPIIRPPIQRPKVEASPKWTAQAGQLPPLALLSQQTSQVKGYTNETLEGMARLVENILDDFGVQVEVVGIQPGPVITRFEIQPAPGVKASRISGLSKDLARALSVTSVRVVEIIPGKSVIGLEIPNEAREIVLLHSVLASDAYQHSDSPLSMVLGKDIGGQPVVTNLAKMPHLLVAGTTGSGKSVAVNVMILSMLFKAGPEQVRMIMIDPKMLELSIYEGIPHLLTPVVTDMKEASNALRWSVAEMERRYKLMSMLGVRNLAGFNHKIQEATEAGEVILDPLWNPKLVVVSEEEGPPPLSPLPNIVIVIDELADMMMIVGKKVEELIARLAQKARAAGIHLILATQRPSVDVLTGLIKANIPTRLSFQVSSRIDSRTIIDQGGAETLLGNGDMLFLPPGTGIPMRAHGAFVSDQEVHDVVEFLKSTGKPDYIEEITRFSEDGGDGEGGFRGYSSDGGDETDPLYDEAVRFVTESRKASISSVQRRLKVGYNRAARMIEDMEKAGIVGPAETNGSRSVLAPPPPS